MNLVKTALLWLWLLSKRLYRRPVFVVMLVLIPALTLGYTTINTEDSGMVTIAVVQEGHPAPEAALMASLEGGEGQALNYRTCASAEEAQTLVAAGKVDTAWIFPEDLEAGVRTFVANPKPENAFIRVVVREDSVMLNLSRERLSATAFTPIARQVYRSFVRDLAPELNTLSDDQLMGYYDDVEISENLFAFDEAYAALVNTHYLLSPLRGLLGLVILLCSLAAALYHYRDMQVGTFCRLGLRWRWCAELAGQTVTTLHLTIATAVCLGLAGLAAVWWQEILLVVLYSLSCAAFSMLLRRLIGSLRGLAAVLPALVVLTLVVCPIFFDLKALLAVRLLFPPTYYIYGAYQPWYLLNLLVYTAVCFGLYALAGLLPGRKESR